MGTRSLRKLSIAMYSEVPILVAWGEPHGHIQMWLNLNWIVSQQSSVILIFMIDYHTDDDY